VRVEISNSIFVHAHLHSRAHTHTPACIHTHEQHARIYTHSRANTRTHSHSHKTIPAAVQDQHERDRILSSKLARCTAAVSADRAPASWCVRLCVHRWCVNIQCCSLAQWKQDWAMLVVFTTCASSLCWDETWNLVQCWQAVCLVCADADVSVHVHWEQVVTRN